MALQIIWVIFGNFWGSSGDFLICICELKMFSEVKKKAQETYWLMLKDYQIQCTTKKG